MYYSEVDKLSIIKFGVQVDVFLFMTISDKRHPSGRC